MSYFSMNKTAKIAISIPKNELKIIESLRHKLSLSRSAVIQQAVKHWLTCQERKGLIDKYERGYSKKPEDPKHIAGWEKASFETLSKEEW